MTLQDIPTYGRAGLAALALVFAVIGASSIDLRTLYNEMYPVEAVKRDAFHICHDADPTFVRAVRSDREACFDGMPHAIAIALGRVRPTAALAIAALLDPSRQAELLLTLAAMPPRRPITAPKSFADTAWMRALSSDCDPKAPASEAPALRRNARTASLGGAIRGNLPPLPHADRAGPVKQAPLPVIPLNPQAAGVASGPAVADLGDQGPPAIVPLPSGGCGGA